MGVLIKAAILVSAGAAIYGMAKLRDTSNQAAKSAATVNQQMKNVGQTASNAFKTGKTRVVAGMNTPTAGGNANIPPGGPPTPPSAPWQRWANAAITQMNKVRQSILGFSLKGLIFGNQQSIPLWERIFGKGSGAVQTHEQRNLHLVINAVNALGRVSNETRGWWKLLFGGASKGASGAKRAVDGVSSAIKKMNSMFSGAAGAMGGALAAIGGTQLLGGAGGLLTRAFDLARQREDAMITFNTLLGDRNKADTLVAGITKYAAATPFTTADITEASKLLLKVSGRDIGKNEELYKLASQIAALSPGRTVAEAAHGITQASMGEFEILKGFMFKLSAEKMKGSGTTGGKEYTEAMLKEIQTQLQSMTGGRDLVAALSGSFSGLMSTVKDSIDEPLRMIGESLMSNLGLKDLFVGYIKGAEKFGRALKIVLDAINGLSKPQFDSDIPAPIRALAEVIGEVIGRLITFGRYVKVVAGKALEWFVSKGYDAQKMIIRIGAAFATVGTVMAIAAPILATIVAAVMALSGPIEAVGSAISGVGAYFLGLGPIILLAAAAFMTFRKKNESLGDTMLRMWSILKQVGLYIYTVSKGAMLGMWSVLSQHLAPAWEKLQNAFETIRKPIVEMLSGFNRAGLTMQEAAVFGRALGYVLSWLLDATVWLVDKGLRLLGDFLEWVAPIIKHTISDLKMMGKAFLGLFTGSVSVKEAFKTFVFGLLDFFTGAIRVVLRQIMLNVADSIDTLAGYAYHLSTALGDNIRQAAEGARKTGDKIMEGFLSTRAGTLFDSEPSFSFNLNAKLDVPIEVPLDGTRVGEGMARVEMRARNSGRGGDPMSPEEMGFVLTGGGIRTVRLTEIAATAG